MFNFIKYFQSLNHSSILVPNGGQVDESLESKSVWFQLKDNLKHNFYSIKDEKNIVK